MTQVSSCKTPIQDKQGQGQSNEFSMYGIRHFIIGAEEVDYDG